MQQTRRTTGRLSLAIAAVVAGMIATTATAAAAPKARALPATGPGGGSATAQRLGAVGPQLATAAVPPNDDAADATFLSRDVRVAADVTAATSAGEPDAGCPFGWGGTVWYRIKGNGGRLIADTWGSGLDTMIAAYDGATGASLGCYDTRNNPADPRNEEAGIVILNTQVGHDYYVQVGNPNGTQPGTLFLSYAASDERAHPGALTPGSSDRTTVGASNSPGELRSCRGVAYTATTWYRINLTQPGTLRFSATGVLWYPAVTLYKAGSTTPLPGCGVPNSSQTASLNIYLRRGAYDVQVGGTQPNPGDHIWGYFTYNYAFAVDPDEDDDGFNRAPYNGSRPPDCADTNPARYPGAWDKADGIDNDCDGFIDEDADHDFHDAIWAGGDDCAPNDTNVHPGARERAGNDIDEDCANGPLYPKLGTDLDSAELKFFNGRITLSKLTLMGVKRGSKVKVTCRGSGCVHRSYSTKVRRTTRRLNLLRKIGETSFTSGTRVQIRVTKPFWIGRVWTLYRQGKHVPEHPKCMVPHNRRLKSCAGR